MRNRRAYTPLTLPSYDLSALAAHLDRMAEKGWFLETVEYSSRFVFLRGKPRKVRHCAVLRPDLTRGGSDETPDPRDVFLDACEEEGWKWIARYQDAFLFRAAREDAKPLQTDFEGCLPAIRERMRPRLLFHCMALVLLLVLLLAWFRYFPFQALSDFLNNFVLFTYAAAAIFLLLSGCLLLQEILRGRAVLKSARKGSPAPVRRRAGLGFPPLLPIAALLALLFLVTAIPSTDSFFENRPLTLEALLGTEVAEESLQQYGASALVESGAAFLQRGASGQFLYARRVNCRFSGVARRVYEAESPGEGARRFSAEECRALGISEGCWQARRVVSGEILDLIVRDGREVLSLYISDLQSPTQDLLEAIRLAV